MTIFRSMVTNTAARSVTELINRAGSAIFWIVLARYLGASGLGSFAFGLSMFNLFTVISTLGLNSVVVRDVARNHDNAGKYFGHTLLLGSVAASVMAVAMIFVSALLKPSTDTLTVSFNADGTNSIGLSGFNGTSGALGLADAAASWANDTNINTAITNLDSAKDTLRTESKEMSNNLSVITVRQDFTEKTINTLEDGVANLTNADMNEEGANMLMLQTRQALGTTSLSLASQAAQSVLRLF